MGAVKTADELKALDAAPHLAAIANRALQRTPVLATRPLAVPRDLYDVAHTEMEARMRVRGFPVPRDADLETRKVEHFLLNGCVIVPE